ncbi:MAG: GAF domain-containing protein [Chloroflexi bacterium]|nr:GAF domain-containing protein [Chloroflexota bacterium]
MSKSTQASQVSELSNHIELIAQASKQLRKTNRIDDALEIALQALSSIDSFAHIYIGLYDPQKKELVIRASYPRLNAIRGLRIPLSERALAHTHSQITAESILKRAQQEQPGQTILDYDPLFRLARSIPLIAQGQILGTVFIGESDKQELAASNEQVITTLVNITAATLAGIGTHQKLIAEVEKQTAELARRQQVAEGFRYILTILNSNRPLEEILQYIISQACWLLDTTLGAAFRWQKDEEKIEVMVSHGLPPQKYHTLGTKAAQNAIRLKQVAISMASTSLAQRTARKPQTQYATELAFPILLADEVYGCICLYFPEQRAFSEEDINLMLIFSEQAALAIENDLLRLKAEQQTLTAKSNRLAIELHDAATQDIFSSSLLVDILPQIMEKNPEICKTKLEELRHLNRAALAEMRSLLLELRPQTLSDIDLGTLMKQLAVVMSSRLQIPVSLEIKHEPSPPLEVKINTYRIVQEALNNIAKHAQATEVKISLRPLSPQDRNSFDLRIQDNGVGFNTERIFPNNLGITIMREQAKAIRASLSIHSSNQQGTVVRCQWPKQPTTSLQ